MPVTGRPCHPPATGVAPCCAGPSMVAAAADEEEPAEERASLLSQQPASSSVYGRADGGDSSPDAASAESEANTPMNKENIPKGIMLQLLACGMFAASHASIKQLGVVHPELSVLVPLWLRYCIFVWFAVPVSTRCSKKKLRATWRTKAPVLQLIRSFLNVVEVGLIYLAVPHLPLADANAVMAMMNIIVTLLAALSPLREHLGCRRACCSKLHAINPHLPTISSREFSQM